MSTEVSPTFTCQWPEPTTDTQHSTPQLHAIRMVHSSSLISCVTLNLCWQDHQRKKEGRQLQLPQDTPHLETTVHKSLNQQQSTNFFYVIKADFHQPLHLIKSRLPPTLPLNQSRLPPTLNIQQPAMYSTALIKQKTNSHPHLAFSTLRNKWKQYMEEMQQHIFDWT